MNNRQQLQEQIEVLRKQLKEKQKELDALPTKWSPKGGDWAINLSGRVCYHYFMSEESKEFGMIYPTEEQADKAAKAMRIYNRLLNYVLEHAPDYEPDWSDEYECKCRLVFDYEDEDELWYVEVDYSEKTLGAVYMPIDVARELAWKLNSGEVEL